MSKEKLRVCVFLEEEEKQEKQVDSKSGEGGEGRRQGRQRGEAESKEETTGCS